MAIDFLIFGFLSRVEPYAFASLLHATKYKSLAFHVVGDRIIV
jgi:hypothetical protein